MYILYTKNTTQNYLKNTCFKYWNPSCYRKSFYGGFRLIRIRWANVQVMTITERKKINWRFFVYCLGTEVGLTMFDNNKVIDSVIKDPIKRPALCSETWGQFHQCSTSSFYTRRSQKCKKDSHVKQLFCAFGICWCKSCL